MTKPYSHCNKLILSFIVLAIAVPAFANSAETVARNFGTRPVTTCPTVRAARKGPPPSWAVKRMVKCNFERNWGNSIVLMDNLKVQVGSTVPWVAGIMTADADSQFPFYAIRGSFTEVVCKREFPWSSYKGKNCTITPISDDEGYCWHSGFGNWECGLGGQDLLQGIAAKDKPPTPGTAAEVSH